MHVLNIAMLLEYTARKAPDQVFLLAGKEGYTYRRADQEANRVANALADLGIGPGDHVALQLPNVGRFPPILFGCFKLGALPILLNVTAPAPEITRYLTASDAVAMIVDASVAPAAAGGFHLAEGCRHFIVSGHPEASCPPPAQDLSELCAGAGTRFAAAAVEGDQPAAMLFSSGTTGLPKGIVHSHLNYYYSAMFSAFEFWHLEPQDVILMVAPGSSIFGQSMLTSTCVAGSCVSLLPRFTPEDFLQTIQDHGVTFFAGVPTLVHFMLNSPIVGQYDLSSLRKVMISGAPLPANVADAFINRFGVDMITGYGMTEGVPVTFLNAAMYREAPAGSVGLPAMGVTVRVVDESGRDQPTGEPGEIVFRGPQLCTGYYRDPEQWAHSMRNGWFHTGDLGRMDANGHLFILERLKEMIKRSGHAVFPSEVEQALYRHPAVAEVAVFGVPHESLGEEITAAVVLKPNTAATARELIDHCKAHVAAYKYPRVIEFHESLPKNHNGKILRHMLRNRGN